MTMPKRLNTPHHIANEMWRLSRWLVLIRMRIAFLVLRHRHESVAQIIKSRQDGMEAADPQPGLAHREILPDKQRHRKTSSAVET